MASNDMNTVEYLLLSDDMGNRFAIPREVVESYRATPEQQAEIEEILGPSVSGYSMYQSFMHQQIADQYQSERRDEASRERMVRSASNEASEQDRVPAPGATEAIGSFLSGMWAKLPFLRQSPTSPTNP